MQLVSEIPRGKLQDERLNREILCQGATEQESDAVWSRFCDDIGILHTYATTLPLN